MVPIGTEELPEEALEAIKAPLDAYRGRAAAAREETTVMTGLHFRCAGGLMALRFVLWLFFWFFFYVDLALCERSVGVA